MTFILFAIWQCHIWQTSIIFLFTARQTLYFVYFVYDYSFLSDTAFRNLLILKKSKSHKIMAILWWKFWQNSTIFCDFQKKESVKYQDDIILCLFCAYLFITMRNIFEILKTFLTVNNLRNYGSLMVCFWIKFHQVWVVGGKNE